ncbi:MAG: hypothetical protein MUE84_18970, partial [Hyphomonas sp.]|nr:hypothetical protein [Hyphomonas sp.]
MTGWWHRATGPASFCASLPLNLVRRCHTLAAAALTAALLGTLAAPALAQDPSIISTPVGNASSFGKPNMFGDVNKNIDRAAPLNLQGDQLVYDTQGNRVIARGNVEIFYNDYILTADEVIYDQN